MISPLITGIGELVTCDDSTARTGSGIRRTRRWSSRASRIAWVGRTRQAPAADRQIDLGGRTRHPRLRRLPLPPGLRRRPRGRVRRPDVRRSRTTGGGIAHHRRRHPRRRPTTSCAAWSAGSGRRVRAQGTTTIEIKSGYGLTVERRGPRAADRRRAHRRDDLPRRPRRAARVRRRPRRLRRPGHRPDARRRGPVRPLDRRVLRAGSPHAFDGDEARRVLAGRSTRPGSACGCTATSSARARACSSPSSWARPASTTAPTCTDADVDALADGADQTVATLLPGVEFSTRSPYPDARRPCWPPASSIALATDCNPGTCYSSSMPFVIAARRPGDGDDPRPGPVRGHRRRGVGAAPRRRRPARRRGPGRPRRPRRPSYLHLAYRPGVPIAAALAATRRDHRCSRQVSRGILSNHRCAHKDTPGARVSRLGHWSSPGVGRHSALRHG